MKRCVYVRDGVSPELPCGRTWKLIPGDGFCASSVRNENRIAHGAEPQECLVCANVHVRLASFEEIPCCSRLIHFHGLASCGDVAARLSAGNSCGTELPCKQPCV